MTLHLEKRAIRALGIAESFQGNEEDSTLAAVVIRSDLIIDGVVFGKIKVGGSDSTETILSLFNDLGRNDVNAVMLSGTVLSLYNVVDVDWLQKFIKRPVIALTFKESRSDLRKNVRARFDKEEANEKLNLLEKLGAPAAVTLNTGYRIFVRTAGIGEIEAKNFLDKFTLQGRVPEPVRIARLMAKAASRLAK